MRISGSSSLTPPLRLRVHPLTGHTGLSLTRCLSLGDFSPHQSTAAGESHGAESRQEIERKAERDGKSEREREGRGSGKEGGIDLIKRW